MDIKASFKWQYHSGLAMLRQAVELCPEEVWLSGEHPRSFWRIAYHAAFYTHLYMGQTETDFQAWGKEREDCEQLWEEPELAQPYTKAEILEYIDYVDLLTDSTVEGLDLAAEDTGFWWYKDMDKLTHELMNLRHLQGHVGQLSELLMQNGVDTNWKR